MTERRCKGCGVPLSDEDVMKIQLEDRSWEVVPLPLCPRCFTEQLRKRVSQKRC